MKFPQNTHKMHQKIQRIHQNSLLIETEENSVSGSEVSPNPDSHFSQKELIRAQLQQQNTASLKRAEQDRNYEEIQTVRQESDQVAVQEATQREKAAIQEAEAIRVTAEREAVEEAARLKTEQDAIARLKADQEAAIRVQATEEAAERVKAAEEEAARVAVEQEVARKLADQEAADKRQAAEDVAKKLKVEQENEEKAATLLRAAEEEAEKVLNEQRIAALRAAEESAAIVQAELKAAAKVLAEQESARLKAAEEAARVEAEQAATAKLKAEEEATRVQAEAEAARVRAEEEAEAAREKAEEEAARLKAEAEAETARVRAEEEVEAAREKAEAETARVNAEKEEATAVRGKVDVESIGSLTDEELPRTQQESEGNEIDVRILQEQKEAANRLQEAQQAVARERARKELEASLQLISSSPYSVMKVRDTEDNKIFVNVSVSDMMNSSKDGMFAVDRNSPRQVEDKKGESSQTYDVCVSIDSVADAAEEDKVRDQLFNFCQ